MKTLNKIIFVGLFLSAGAAAVLAILNDQPIIAWLITMCIVGYAVWLAFDILYCQLKRLLFELPIFLRILNEEHKYTEADLVKFGKYLLSEQREQSIENKENLREVTDADIANAFEK